MLGPPGLEFQILCLDGSGIAFISPSSGSPDSLVQCVILVISFAQIDFIVLCPPYGSNKPKIYMMSIPMFSSMRNPIVPIQSVYVL